MTAVSLPCVCSQIVLQCNVFIAILFFNVMWLYEMVLQFMWLYYKLFFIVMWLYSVLHVHVVVLHFSDVFHKSVYYHFYKLLSYSFGIFQVHVCFIANHKYSTLCFQQVRIYQKINYVVISLLQVRLTEMIFTVIISLLQVRLTEMIFTVTISLLQVRLNEMIITVIISLLQIAQKWCLPRMQITFPQVKSLHGNLCHSKLYSLQFLPLSNWFFLFV